jgi:LysB family phage lysis regulatory protein
MNWITAKLIGASLAIAVMVASASYVRALRAELATLKLKIGDARRNIAERDSLIHRLQQDATMKAAQQARLNRAQDSIASKLAATRLENRRLIDENADLRAWADIRLPDDVVRLQTSPAITGADDYLERVPGGEPMHAPSDDTAHER